MSKLERFAGNVCLVLAIPAYAIIGFSGAYGAVAWLDGIGPWYTWLVGPSLIILVIAREARSDQLQQEHEREVALLHRLLGHRAMADHQSPE